MPMTQDELMQWLSNLVQQSNTNAQISAYDQTSTPAVGVMTQGAGPTPMANAPVQQKGIEPGGNQVRQSLSANNPPAVTPGTNNINAQDAWRRLASISY